MKKKGKKESKVKMSINFSLVQFEDRRETKRTELNLDMTVQEFERFIRGSVRGALQGAIDASCNGDGFDDVD